MKKIVIVSALLLTGCSNVENKVGRYEDFRSNRMGAVVGRVILYKEIGGTVSSGSQWCNRKGFCFMMNAPVYGKESVYFVPPGTYTFSGITTTDFLTDAPIALPPAPITFAVKAGQVSYLGDLVFDSRSDINEIHINSTTHPIKVRIDKKVAEAKAAIAAIYPDVAARIK